jgi:hypothetical protein
MSLAPIATSIKETEMFYGKVKSKLVVHVWNPSYLGGWDQEDWSSRPTQQIVFKTHHLKNNQTKMDWRCGLSSRVPGLQVPVPDFKPQSHQKKKKKIGTMSQVITWEFSLLRVYFKNKLKFPQNSETFINVWQTDLSYTNSLWNFRAIH